MNERTRHAITSALFEAFFVVLAVALALAANEWRQDRVDRERAASALASVVQELQANRAAVDESREYHSGLLRKIAAAQRESSLLGPSDYPRGFTLPASVFRTAWEAAAETGALSHMEYQTVLELSRLYALQGRYEAQVAAISQLIYSELLQNGVAGMAANAVGLRSLILAYSYKEAQLVSDYDKTLTMLESGAVALQSASEAEE